MFANNEKGQGVNRAEVFAKMLGELPWANFRCCIQANAPLLKLCTFGGHRLEPQKRDRLEKIVYREAEKAEFSEAVRHFAAWYPVNQDLHRKLEDYFHSMNIRIIARSKTSRTMIMSCRMINSPNFSSFASNPPGKSCFASAR